MKRRIPFLVVALSCHLAAARAGELAGLNRHDEEAIQKAMRADAQAAERAKLDPNRPAYHILAPANWINDPNGPIFHNGVWHMFYQHNPYGDDWGNMHWGHVQSRDLAHWEHRPIALWPSKEVGEEHVFSGCATVRKDGKPVILYTSIGRGKSASDDAEQWLAVGDSELQRWEKSPENPALAPSIHGDVRMWDWRDPFLFKYQGADYLVLGGNLNRAKGGQAVVNLYKAKDDSLLHWDYLGILFTHPDPKAVNIECPNFFELDGKWVLIVSPHRRVEYFIGEFDGKTFRPEKQGLMDYADNFYAPNCTTDGDGRWILWGWIRGFPGGQGWNGCHTVPRILKISKGDLTQVPAPEIEKLHGRELLNVTGKTLSESEPLKVRTATSQLDISARFSNANRCGLKFSGEGSELEIAVQDGELRVGGKKAPLNPTSGTPLELRVLVDHSVVEVYANGTLCLTTVTATKAVNSELAFLGGAEPQMLSARVFEMTSAW